MNRRRPVHCSPRKRSKSSVTKKPDNSTQTDRFSENIEYRGQIYTRNNYFEDRKRKVDYVLVSSLLKVSEELDKLVTYIVNLMQQGVEYEISPGKSWQAHQDLVFIKLHCPLPVLQHNANIYNILFDCQNPRYLPTQYAWFHWKIFNNITTQPDPFHPDYVRAVSSLSRTKLKSITSWERSLILEKILTKTSFGAHPKQKGLKKLRAAHVLTDAYPTHDGPWQWKQQGPLTDRQLLSKYWADFSCIFKNQPICLIYKYYGPEVAFYFVFVDYYTKMLTIPAIIGTICFIYSAIHCHFMQVERITEVCTSKAVLCPNCFHPKQCDFIPLADICYAAYYDVLFDNISSVAFAIFSSLWATIFIGLWLRREFVFKFHWNLLNSQVDMTQRAEFAHKAKSTRISPLSGERVNYVPCHIKFFKCLLTALFFIFMLGVICLCLGIVVYTRLYLRRLITQSEWQWLRKYKDIVVMTINAFHSLIFINLLTPHFLKISQFLTNEENPSSLLAFYNSCTYKFYVLSFFNNYVPIFYVALFKGTFFTHPADMENYNIFGWRTDICTAVGCSFVLTIFLTYFMSSELCINHTFYYIRITFMRIFIKWRGKKIKDENIKVMPAWERDYTLRKCGDLFLMREFMELVIQYGFVIFFVAGLPLAPLFAMITNIVRLRLVAKRILKTYRRPLAKVLPGIGAWNSILGLVTFVGAMTNAVVIAFTSDLIDLEVYRNSHDTVRGFINSTFSEFAVKDYPPKFENLLKKSTQYETCSYKGRRNPPQDEKKYELNEDHWKVLCCKLCFILIFQQMIWLLSAICSNTISRVPDEVLEELNDEAIKIRENRFETIEESFYERMRLSSQNFEIE